MAEPILDDAELPAVLAGSAGEHGGNPVLAPRSTGSAGLPASSRRTRRDLLRHALSLAPFSAYVTLFLLGPAVYILVKAFQDTSGHWTLANFRFILFSSPVYRDGFLTSLELSLITAVVPAIAGLLVAYAVHAAPAGSPLRRGVIAVSGIFSQFGGVPLAFMFIAAIGPSGLASGWLSGIGVHISGEFLSSFWGVALVYMYFQIPLMVLVIMPALEGLRPATREAAQSLGARWLDYWRFVGGPVLLPSFLGGVLLLFCFALAAYATAYALTSDTIALTPVQIGDFLNGNSIVGQQSVAYALGLGMLATLVAVMVVYSFLQRRASRWQR